MPRPVILNIQMLRFAAAFAILATHAFSLVAPDAPIVGSVPWVMGVDIFFVISGFIMAWLTRGSFGEPGAAWTFFKRRVVRIVPPYWFFTLLTAALVLVAGGRIQHVTAEPMQLLTSLAFLPWPRSDGQLVPILPQGWTLNYEAFFYLAFAAAMVLRRGRLVLAVSLFAIGISGPLVPEGWFGARFFADPIILEFVAGIALAQLYLSDVRLRNEVALLFIIVAVAFYVAATSAGMPFVRPVIFGIPATLIAAAFILAPEPANPGLFRRMLAAGGDASYTLYLSHKLVVHAVVAVSAAIGFRNPAVSIAAALTAAIAFALIFYRWIEKPFVTALGAKMHAPIRTPAQKVAP